MAFGLTNDMEVSEQMIMIFKRAITGLLTARTYQGKSLNVLNMMYGINSSYDTTK